VNRADRAPDHGGERVDRGLGLLLGQVQNRRCHAHPGLVALGGGHVGER
jgi:hypothetical protein